MDTARLVKAYLKMREARATLKRSFEEEDNKIKAQMEKLESTMLGFLNSSQIDSVATPTGTFYRQEEITPTCADWHTFHGWIKDNDAFDFLEKRVTKKAVKDYMESNAGAIPPGLSIFREFVVRVRRPS